MDVGVPCMAGFLPTSRVSWKFRLEPYDVCCAFVAPWIAFTLRDPRLFDPGLIDQAVVYSCISLSVGIATMSWSRIGNIIFECFSRVDCYRVIRAAFTSVSLASFSAFLVTRLDSIPRSLPVIHFFVLGSLLVLGRLVRARRPNAGMANNRLSSSKEENIIVIGANNIGSAYIRLVERFGSRKQKILAVIDLDPQLRNRTLAGHQVIGVPEDLPRILVEYKTHGIDVDKLVVAIERPEISQTIRKWLCSNIADDGKLRVEYVAERLGLANPSSEALVAQTEDADSQLKTISALGTLRSRNYWRLKRTGDVVIAAVLLTLLAPFLAIVALVVRLKIGSPVIFWQRRVGRGGGGIYVFKFRTLRAPFDKTGGLLRESERLSPVGTFLRRTKIDELPQLFNILRGDMSLIGPRPLLPIDQPSQVGSRLLVPPGITGWAQVHGGSLISANEKNALDEYYIRNASLRLDLKILLRTAIIIFTGDRLVGPDVEVPNRSRQNRSCNRFASEAQGT